MGLFKKVKEILFDEEEFTEQIKITPEMRNEDVVTKESEKPKQVISEPKETLKEEPKENLSERELFKSDSTFPFLDFDEEEFKSNTPVKVPEPTIQKPRVSNVLEYERKKKVEKRTDFGRYEKVEITETTERRKFKPSPIISPVYGIINQNYDKSDLIKKSDSDKVDIQSVRDKAFGEKKEETDFPKTYYEETETVTISEPTEKAQKVKTIDELLEDTSDVVVDIDGELENELEEIEATIDEKAKKEDIKVPNVEDTLENDLFDLIDSMYDNKEEGE